MRFMIIDTCEIIGFISGGNREFNAYRTAYTELQKTSNLQTRFGDIFSGIGDIFGPKDG